MVAEIQIGVVLFMFIVGMEVNVQHVREKGSAGVMTGPLLSLVKK